MLKIQGKLVRLQVDESHTIGQVVEQMIEGLDLPRDKSYNLVLGEQMFGLNRYSLTVRDWGIKDGDRLRLISEIIEGRVSPTEVEKIETSKPERELREGGI